MSLLKYAVYRLFTMLVTLWVVSILIFFIINLPPGDYQLHLGMYTWPEVVRVPLAGVQETTVMVTEFQLP